MEKQLYSMIQFNESGKLVRKDYGGIEQQPDAPKITIVVNTQDEFKDQFQKYAKDEVTFEQLCDALDGKNGAFIVSLIKYTEPILEQEKQRFEVKSSALWNEITERRNATQEVDWEWFKAAQSNNATSYVKIKAFLAHLHYILKFRDYQSKVKQDITDRIPMVGDPARWRFTEAEEDLKREGKHKKEHKHNIVKKEKNPKLESFSVNDLKKYLNDHGVKGAMINDNYVNVWHMNRKPLEALFVKNWPEEFGDVQS